MTIHDAFLSSADIAYNSFYRIHSTRLEGFMKKFDQMNKRATKMGSFPIKVEVLGEMTRIADKKTGELDVYTCLTIEGEAPTFNGWSFIATLEHTIAGNIVRNAPNKETPASFREVDNYCEHCKSRRRRKETFVLLHEDGTYKQVGRNCIKDFLDGHANPEAYGRWFDMLGKLEEEAESSWAGGGGGERIFDLTTYMAYVMECISLFGWISGTYARDQRNLYDRYVESTSMSALRNMLPPKNKEDKKDFDFPSDESIEKAKLVVSWGVSLKERVELGDYLHNLTVIANLGYVTWDKMSFAASMASAYQREMDGIEYKKREAKEKAERPVSEYVGTEGVRGEFTVIVNKVLTLETMFGTTKFHIMEDENGNSIVWFSSNKELDVNATYTLKATVKEHKVYEGRKQTVLTRCAVV